MFICPLHFGDWLVFLRAFWQGCDVHCSLGIGLFFCGRFGKVVMFIAVWGSACFFAGVLARL